MTIVTFVTIATIVNIVTSVAYSHYSSDSWRSVPLAPGQHMALHVCYTNLEVRPFKILMKCNVCSQQKVYVSF